MRNKLLWLSFIFIASGAAVAAYHPLMRHLNETPVTNSISFSLYKGSNYSSKVYRSSSAEIYITVEKVRNTARTIVWDTTLDAKLLRKYPPLEKAFSKTIIIPGIFESKEHVEMNYVLTYSSSGHILTIPSERFILNSKDTVAIRL